MVILDLCLKKSRSGDYLVYLTQLLSKSWAFKMFSVHRKTKSRRFQIPPRFRKAAFLWRISVDGSPVPELSFLPAPYRGWTRAGERRVWPVRLFFYPPVFSPYMGREERRVQGLDYTFVLSLSSRIKELTESNRILPFTLLASILFLFTSCSLTIFRGGFD